MIHRSNKTKRLSNRLAFAFGCWVALGMGAGNAAAQWGKAIEDMQSGKSVPSNWKRGEAKTYSATSRSIKTPVSDTNQRSMDDLRRIEYVLRHEKNAKRRLQIVHQLESSTYSRLDLLGVLGEAAQRDPDPKVRETAEMAVNRILKQDRNLANRLNGRDLPASYDQNSHFTRNHFRAVKQLEKEGDALPLNARSDKLVTQASYLTVTPAGQSPAPASETKTAKSFWQFWKKDVETPRETELANSGKSLPTTKMQTARRIPVSNVNIPAQFEADFDTLQEIETVDIGQPRLIATEGAPQGVRAPSNFFAGHAASPIGTSPAPLGGVVAPPSAAEAQALAVAILAQARESLTAGDLDLAQQLVDHAKSLAVEFPDHSDNPLSVQQAIDDCRGSILPPTP